nr:MAG TPA: hypothetical protein [Caudoviricetes sp.]
MSILIRFLNEFLLCIYSILQKYKIRNEFIINYSFPCKNLLNTIRSRDYSRFTYCFKLL